MSLPIVDPSDRDPGEGARPDARVAGVLLAAGASTRFGGENKLLRGVDGEALVRRAARSLREGGVEPAIAVVGHQADRVREALAGLEVGIVGNPDYRDGQASSVRAGVRAVWGADAAVFALGDMPFVRPSSVGALLAAYRAGAGSALAAAVDGERGNPVLFDSRHFDSLAALEGDVGGREVLLEAADAALVETGDPGVRRDVDRPGDLRGGRT